MRPSTALGPAFLLAALLVLSVAPHAGASSPSSSASAPALPPAPENHYLPVAGDTFTYTESYLIDNAFGNVSGYVEDDFYNGSLTVMSVLPNGTASVYWQYTGNWYDNQGDSGTYGASGNFTFNAWNYSYAQGNDQGAPEPLTVWFYMNNSDSVGASISLTNTPLTVDSTDQSYALTGSSTGYVQTIFAEGTGTTQDDSGLGNFPADYTWMAYFDPSTGYIIGYQYEELDNDGAGDGFNLINTLHVTHTSYPLTSSSAPATASIAISTGSSGCPILLGGGNYSSGATASLQPGATYLLTYYPCGSTFDSWSATGAALGSTTAGSTTLKVSGSGTLTATFTAPPPAPFPWGTVIVVLILLVLFVLLVYLVFRRSHHHARSNMSRHGAAGQVPFSSSPPLSSGYGGPAPLNLTPGDQPAVQQIVIKETVKVPCAYCGTLIDSTATACPKCGAPRT